MKIGGESGWLQATAIARVYGVEVSIHPWPEMSARLRLAPDGALVRIGFTRAEPLCPDAGQLLAFSESFSKRDKPR